MKSDVLNESFTFLIFGFSFVVNVNISLRDVLLDFFNATIVDSYKTLFKFEINFHEFTFSFSPLILDLKFLLQKPILSCVIIHIWGEQSIHFDVLLKILYLLYKNNKGFLELIFVEFVLFTIFVVELVKKNDVDF